MVLQHTCIYHTRTRMKGFVLTAFDIELVLICSGLYTSAGHCPDLTASRSLSTRRRVRRDAERRTVIITYSKRSHFCFTGRSSYSSTPVSFIEFTYPQGELLRISHCDCILLLSERMKFGAEIAECIEDWRKCVIWIKHLSLSDPGTLIGHAVP